jgi:DtxR family Mn-dependent transcriptional regulator
MKKSKRLTESLENYLCAISDIEKESGAARVKDISASLSIGASSVSEAMKLLEKKEFINYKPYGVITLTKTGQKLVEEKKNRSDVISKFLREVLLVDENDVAASARSIEYSMNEDVLNRFVKLLTFMQSCSCKEPKWIKSFKYYVQNKDFQQKCQSCMSDSTKTGCGSDNTGCCGQK